MIYDRIARQEWAERTAANEASFDVDEASVALQESILMAAEAEFDKESAQDRYRPQEKGQQKGKGKGKGYERRQYQNSWQQGWSNKRQWQTQESEQPAKQVMNPCIRSTLQTDTSYLSLAGKKLR